MGLMTSNEEGTLGGLIGPAWAVIVLVVLTIVLVAGVIVGNAV